MSKVVYLSAMENWFIQVWDKGFMESWLIQVWNKGCMESWIIQVWDKGFMKNWFVFKTGSFRCGIRGLYVKMAHSIVG